MADLPEPIRFGVHLLSVAAATSAYAGEHEGMRHRAEKAAHLVVHGPERAVRRLDLLIWALTALYDVWSAVTCRPRGGNDGTR